MRKRLVALLSAAALAACTPKVERVGAGDAGEIDDAGQAEAAAGSGGDGVDAGAEAPPEDVLREMPGGVGATEGGMADGAGPPVWNGSQTIVAVGNDGLRMHSAAGVTWVGEKRDVTGNRDGPKVLRSVAYGNKLVVAVGGGCTSDDCVSRLMTFDGKTWSEVILPVAVGHLFGVAYGGGIWVAVGYRGQVIRSVDDGKTWTLNPIRVETGGLRGVAYGIAGGAEMFVAVGEGYVRSLSYEGLNWKDTPSDGTVNGFSRVAIGNGVIVVAGGRRGLGRRMRSIDGVTWTDEITDGAELTSLVFADGKFMAYAGSTEVHVSINGKTWMTQAITNGGSNAETGVLDNMRLFISRSAPATIKISTDGVVWTTKIMSVPGDATINAFVFAGS